MRALRIGFSAAFVFALYAIGDILISALFKLNGSTHSWEYVTFLLAIGGFSVSAVGMIGGMAWQTFIPERKQAGPPRPDYSRIATLEQEIYGETFTHDGAPATRITNVSDRLCKRCYRRGPACDCDQIVWRDGRIAYLGDVAAQVPPAGLVLRPQFELPRSRRKRDAAWQQWEREHWGK